MVMDDPPGLAKRIFSACLLLLGAAVALRVMVNIIGCIWPWLLAIGLAAVGVYGLVWWLCSRSSW